MSFPRYPKYKDSGVEWLGEVPEHWGVCAFKHCMRMRYGDALAAEMRQDGDIEVYGSNGAVGTHCVANTKSPAIVVGRKGSFGKVVWAELGGFVIDTAYIIDADTTAQNLHWVFYTLHPMGLDSISQDTGVPGLAREKAYEIQLAVPPPVEQTHIAAFLDRETAKIDDLVGEQRRLIELLKEKRQAVISHAVTKGLNSHAPMKPSGIEWFGDVPAHWEVGPLKRYWSVTDCKHVTAEFVEDGIPLASIREVQSRWVALENAKRTTEYFYELLIEGGRRPSPGDLIFSRNATVGEVAQVSVDHPSFAMGQDVVLLRKLSPEYSSDYLQHVIRSPIIIQQLANMMIGSTFKRINVEEIRSFVLPSPPPSEQAEISAYLEDEVTKLDALTAEAQRAIDLLQERRTALISAAVTGQIDVRQFTQ